MDTTIVVGSDSSAPSRAAVSWAARRAVDLSKSLLLCHVIDTEWAGNEGSPEDQDERVRAELDSEVRRVRSTFPGVDVRSEVLAGRPVAVLAELALGGEMLVVGTHKTGFIHGRIFESQFAGLTAAIEVPVVFMPASGVSHRRGVVAGVGESASTGAVIAMAGAEAERFGDPLVLLGSWHGPMSGGGALDSGRDRLMSSRVAEALDGAARLAATEFPTVPVIIRNRHEDAATALIDASLSARQLVVGQPMVPSRASVIHDVLLNLSCPTLVVREPPSPSRAKLSVALTFSSAEGGSS